MAQSNTAFPKKRMAGAIETSFNISHSTIQRTWTQI